MRSSFVPVLLLIVLLSALPALGGTPSEAVVFPDAAHPAVVGADRLLEVHASLRLPLTPPPGVQQTAAVRGWRIVLTAKNGWNLDNTPASVRYELPVMRIRPLKGDVYRILAEPPPWLAEGRYDVAVQGPGFNASSRNAVIIPGASGTEPPRFATLMNTAADHTFLLTAEPDDASQPSCLRIVLPKSMPGISVTYNGAALSPSEMTFAALPITGARVLTFSLPKQPSGKIPMRLQWSAVSAAPCDGRILLSEAVKNDAMAYRDLTFRTSRQPKSILWDFGDGRYGIGASVRRRWMLTDEARISAWAIDDNGRVCEDHRIVKLNELARENGCSCTAVGNLSDARRTGRYAAFFFLFLAAFGE